MSMTMDIGIASQKKNQKEKKTQTLPVQKNYYLEFNFL